MVDKAFLRRPFSVFALFAGIAFFVLLYNRRSPYRNRRIAHRYPLYNRRSPYRNRRIAHRHLFYNRRSPYRNRRIAHRHLFTVVATLVATVALRIATFYNRRNL